MIIDDNSIFFTLWIIAFAVVYFVIEILYHLFKIDGSYTRKMIHVFEGMLLLYYPFVFGSHITPLIVCSVIMVILYYGRKKDFFQSLFDVPYCTDGSFYYLISIYVLLLCWSYHTYSYTYYRIPLAIMTFADPMAALVGMHMGGTSYKLVSGERKTLTGSIAFFITAFLSAFVIFFIQKNVLDMYSYMIISIIIAFITTIVEAISPRGSDNLTVIIAAILLLTFVEFLLGVSL